MTDRAAIQAEYVDLKFIKTRKVAQVVLEIPIEHADVFIAGFGTPRPDGYVPVALARIYMDRNDAPDDPLPSSTSKLVTQCVMTCKEGAFPKFIGEYVQKLGQDVPSPPSAEQAVHWLRQLLGVNSRSELKTNQRAAAVWRDIRSQYDLWLRGIAA